MAVIMALVVALTFLFGFGNVWLLALRLGVPGYVAPLVAPAVDLTVLGLLLAIRELAYRGASVDQIRPARRLLVFASLVTLALNVAEPAIAGDVGKAVFDAVGPLLLIGWAETGPGILHAMAATRPTTRSVEVPSAVEPEGVASAGELLERSATAVDGNGSVSADVAGVGGRPGGAFGAATGVRRRGQVQLSPELLERARREDAAHRRDHDRPVSAETLRKRLRVGAATARLLVARVRMETGSSHSLGRIELHLAPGPAVEGGAGDVAQRSAPAGRDVDQRPPAMPAAA
ncbi:hypothetical protein I6A84_02330 [Frankia sp. CNm7]|uniref:DUF2637 domain-containing protein n=1 Tax=Frankia nepalensis TaxID=1836974 RepID=A0A937US18_9ACTN|nr:hypothetical protein [Frankia nepalensis]MBL7500970.1 hypothetical protein [Frankia nepalensis]MBL7512422.1 hypothetical protein [Frankia nepalensis]MBL7516995.1 hypothetical protein [Frankia nepalensis]MBL7631967.1 hypothetical protein [Frankia nepalensis]